MKWWFVLCLFFSVWYAPAQTINNSAYGTTLPNTLLWEISGNGLAKPSYLFGTFHLLCKKDIKFSPVLLEALANSRELYLELDLDDPATLLGALTQMNMKGGKQLRDLYNDSAYNRLSSFFKDSLQTSLSAFQKMKPALLISLIYPKMMPCDETDSPESMLMQLAKKQGKPTQGLETMAFQASVFDSIPVETQAAELLQTIDSMQLARNNFNLMLSAYLEQRLDQIEAIINNPELGNTTNQSVLLYNRNFNWVEKLKDILKNQSVFIAVGAGHLVGKYGLIALLKEAGYTLKGMNNQ